MRADSAHCRKGPPPVGGCWSRRRVQPTWPTTMVIRTRPARSGHCRPQRALTALPWARAPARWCWRCRAPCQGTKTSSRRYAPTSTASSSTPPCAAVLTTGRRWSSCAATSPGRPWPTSACRPTPPGRCSSSRPNGATAPRTWSCCRSADAEHHRPAQRRAHGGTPLRRSAHPARGGVAAAGAGIPRAAERRWPATQRSRLVLPAQAARTHAG